MSGRKKLFQQYPRGRWWLTRLASKTIFNHVT